MKIHVPSMLAIGVDKHTQQTKQAATMASLSTAILEQPLWLRKITITISHNGLENNNQPPWLRK